MDDLLREFLTETSESLDTVDNQLVRFEQLHAMAEGAKHAAAEPVAAPVPVVAAPPVQPAITQEVVKGTLIEQVLERPLRPGEVSLDDLERAFRETETEVTPAPKPAPAAVAKQAAPAPEAAPAAKEAKAKPAKRAAVADTDVQEADKIANQS